MTNKKLGVDYRQRGITGLETAIILIAFVVVASVFSFTVLSTGVFASERSKETVYAGLEEAKSSLEPKGSVIAYIRTCGHYFVPRFHLQDVVRTEQRNCWRAGRPDAALHIRRLRIRSRYLEWCRV